MWFAAFQVRALSSSHPTPPPRTSGCSQQTQAPVPPASPTLRHPREGHLGPRKPLLQGQWERWVGVRSDPTGNNIATTEHSTVGAGAAPTVTGLTQHLGPRGQKVRLVGRQLRGGSGSQPPRQDSPHCSATEEQARTRHLSSRARRQHVTALFQGPTSRAGPQSWSSLAPGKHLARAGAPRPREVAFFRVVPCAVLHTQALPLDSGGSPQARVPRGRPQIPLQRVSQAPPSASRRLSTRNDKTRRDRCRGQPTFTER